MATRRGFLGGVLGAAAAGPAVVSSGLAKASSGIGMQSGLFPPADGWVGRSTAKYSPVADLHKQMDNIRKMSADDKRERYGAYHGDMRRSGIQSLRSVSDTNKARMIFEAEVEANYQSDIKRILRALAGLETN